MGGVSIYYNITKGLGCGAGGRSSNLCFVIYERPLLQISKNICACATSNSMPAISNSVALLTSPTITIPTTHDMYRSKQTHRSSPTQYPPIFWTLFQHSSFTLNLWKYNYQPLIADLVWLLVMFEICSSKSKSSLLGLLLFKKVPVNWLIPVSAWQNCLQKDSYIFGWRLSLWTLSLWIIHEYQSCVVRDQFPAVWGLIYHLLPR